VGFLSIIKAVLKAFRDPLVGVHFALKASVLFEMPVGPTHCNAPFLLTFGAPYLQDRDGVSRHG
jgi:hypothetical protein